MKTGKCEHLKPTTLAQRDKTMQKNGTSLCREELSFTALPSVNFISRIKTGSGDEIIIFGSVQLSSKVLLKGERPTSFPHRISD